METLKKPTPKKSGGAGRTCHMWKTASKDEKGNYYRVSFCGIRKSGGGLPRGHTNCSERGCHKCVVCLDLSVNFRRF